MSGWAPNGRPAMPRGWAKTRARFLRANPRCAKCGGRASEVDHRTPRHLGGSDLVENLQSLCGACHRVKTAAESAAQIRRLRALGRRDAGRHPGLL